MAALKDLFALAQFSSGRRISAYNQIRPIAVARDLPALIRHLDRAKAHDVRTRELESRWAAQTRRGLYPAELGPVDNLVDNILASIRDIAVAQAKGLEPGHELHDEVHRFIDALFPAGVAAITSLPYVDQAAAVEVLLEALQGELAPTVARLGLGLKVERLAELMVTYRRLVDHAQKPLRFATVRAARERGQEYLREIISIIAGTFFDADDPAHVAARDALLAPIRAHEKRVRAALRARRRGYRDELAEPESEAKLDEPDEAAEPDQADEPDTGEPAEPESSEPDAKDRAGPTPSGFHAYRSHEPGPRERAAPGAGAFYQQE